MKIIIKNYPDAGKLEYAKAIARKYRHAIVDESELRQSGRIHKIGLRTQVVIVTNVTNLNSVKSFFDAEKLAIKITSWLPTIYIKMPSVIIVV